MLSLTRKPGETVVITHGGEQLTITVLKVESSNRVRLSFTAPPSFRILRSELLEREPLPAAELAPSVEEQPCPTQPS